MERLQQAYDPALFQKQGYQLVDILTKYLQTSLIKKEKTVLPWREPEEMLSLWEGKSFPHGIEDFVPLFKSIINETIHLHHPRYMGHLVSPVSPIAALADFFSAFINNGVGVYEMGSPAVALEKVVIKRLLQTFNLDCQQADGFLTSGGSLANLTALLAARQTQCEYDVWNEGYQKNEQLAIMVSKEAHYSVSRAAKIMGLGERGIIKLPTNKKFQIDVNGLSENYQTALKNGKKAFALVANACSTASGAYDTLPELADYCKKNNIWFHVDGAHGGAAIFSPKYKHYLNGIEQADSISLDFHKMLMMPALASAVLFRNGNNSYEAFAQKAPYLWSDIEEREWFNLAKRTFECTKSMISIKIYAMLCMYGTELFAENVTKLFDLGQQFARLIEQTDVLQLFVQPTSNIVCYRYNPADLSLDELNKINLLLRDKLIKAGQFYITGSYLNDAFYLRTAIMNPFTTVSDLLALIGEIEKIADGIQQMKVKNELSNIKQ